MCLGGRAFESRTTPLPWHPQREAKVVLSSCLWFWSGRSEEQASRGCCSDWLAVAHFCFNQAVRFANVLPEVPSETSLFAPCVESSSFSECITIKVSLADVVKVIKRYSRLSFVMKSSPFWISCFCSWKEGLASALVVVPSWGLYLPWNPEVIWVEQWLPFSQKKI